MKFSLAAVAVAALNAVPALALSQFGFEKPHMRPFRATEGERLERRDGMRTFASHGTAASGNATFSQWLDHKDQTAGRFEQRFWWNATNWGGPGYPIFLINAGEADDAEELDGYMTPRAIPGRYAAEFKGAVILIEHRYFGKSLPYKTLTAETMRFHNLPNAISDMTNFARNVKLPFDKSTNGQANAPNSPWVLVGGSYAGALAAWTEQLEPHTFWAYHASSAVVQAISRFHTYFDPIEEAMPSNCSANIRTVVAHVDKVLSNGTEAEILQLKTLFGLEKLKSHDDFTYQVANALLWWQSDSRKVLRFCDYVQGFYNSAKDKNAPVPVNQAVFAYASWVNSTSAAYCRQTGSLCDSYSNVAAFNQPNAINDMNRSWRWLVCHNPFSWWITGPPESDGTNIVSKFLTEEYYTRRCGLEFPPVGQYRPGITEGFTPEHLNLWTEGWNGEFTRTIFVDGEFDPWRSAGVQSSSRPGGPRKSTPQTPMFIIDNGIHCPDLIIDDIPSEREVLPKILSAMSGWLVQWRTLHRPLEPAKPW